MEYQAWKDLGRTIASVGNGEVQGFVIQTHVENGSNFNSMSFTSHKKTYYFTLQKFAPTALALAEP